MSSRGGRYEPVPRNDSDALDNDADEEIEEHELVSHADFEDAEPLVAGHKQISSLRWNRGSSKFDFWHGSSRRRCCVFFIAATLLMLSVLGGGFLWITRTRPPQDQSPAWYPTPLGGRSSPWRDSYLKAQKLVEQMTLVEKVNITTGTGWAMNLCVGNTGPVPRLGFPSLCLQDGPLGIRFVDHATSFPAGITVGATWNRTLMHARGSAHARQARLKGVNVLLSPVVGPLGRNPAGGRNWEGFGADPVLQAVASYETIQGIQSEGVIATVKHFIGNEQEHFRKPFEWALPEALSSNIDDRTLHELYLWPFAESVRAGVASVMCSYQMINNSYGCANSKLMNGILKDELGFQGFVQSDWLAQRSGVASALAGLDMTMPGDGLYWLDGKSLFGEQLTVAILNGSLPVTRLNDMVTRIVAAWYQLGQDSWDNEGPNFSSWTPHEKGKWHDGAKDSQEVGVVNKFVKTETDESKSIAKNVAVEGTVLVKNDGILPLDPRLSSLGQATKKVMVVGEDAGPGRGANVCVDRGCNQGTLAVGWGSGATEFSYLVDPLVAFKAKLDSDAVEIKASLNNQVTKELKASLKQQDLCLVFANADSGEGYIHYGTTFADRNDLEIQKDGSALIREVALNCKGPTIVVIHAVGPVILEEFIDMPRVKAVLLANLPGQESGTALVDVLFGEADASGRLPYTVGKSLKDYGPGAKVLYVPNAVVPQVDFKEGLYIDYRYFDKNGIDPRFPFGYGLSYTTFELSDLHITTLKPKTALPDPRPPPTIKPPSYDETIPSPETALLPAGFHRLQKYIYPYITSVSQVKSGKYPYPKGYDTPQEESQAGGAEGGNPSLFMPHVQVSVKITNTGTRSGQHVIQLYLSYPEHVIDPISQTEMDMPVKVLRNFTKVNLEPGQEEVVTMNLTRKDLSYWSVYQQNWVMPVDGEFTLRVGSHSRDLPLTGAY